MRRLSYVVVGSGRVATCLAKLMAISGLDCHGVYSRTREHAEVLATDLASPPLDTMTQVWETSVDFILFAVNDTALTQIASEIPKGQDIPVLLHTSGATPMDVLSQAKDYGVFYPLQTFSQGRMIPIEEIPFYCEASSDKARQILEEIIHTLDIDKVVFCNSLQRRYLHLAAVFASNFVNYMYTSAYKVMSIAGLDPSMLHPIMKETLSKLDALSPLEAQTGPAMRGDFTTLERHLTLLSEYPELYRLYTEISRLISEEYTQE